MLLTSFLARRVELAISRAFFIRICFIANGDSPSAIYSPQIKWASVRIQRMRYRCLYRHRQMGLETLRRRARCRVGPSRTFIARFLSGFSLPRITRFAFTDILMALCIICRSPPSLYILSVCESDDSALTLSSCNQTFQIPGTVWHSGIKE